MSTLTFAQVGDTDSPFATNGWDAPEDSTTYYNLPIYRLLSNPGGWINISQRMVDSLFNALIVYTDTSELYIQNDTLRLHPSISGADTVWDDLRVPMNSITPGIANPPDWVQLTGLGNLYGLAFNQSTEEEVYFEVQMPHAWLEGSEIRPHIHWTSDDAAEGTTVVWGLEYSIAEPFGTFPSSTTDTMHVDDPALFEHQLDSFSAIDMTGKTLSSVILCRLYRVAGDAADDYVGDAFLITIDFHYQIDARGSQQEYIK